MPKVFPWETASTLEPKSNRKIMPVLSKFYGIVIRMLFAQPLAAHFHAIYQDWELVVGIDPPRVLNGSAPFRVRAMVLEWAVMHQEELLAAWQNVSHARAPARIAPLP
jgi:hypothetical protein